ncbi:MAG: hypothetical protein ACREF4_11060, partial [Gammaproteobacteria bacterium]
MNAETPRSAGVGTEQDGVPAEWLAEFEAAARRSLPTRFRYAFIKTYKPVLDDEPFRAFDTTADLPPLVRGEPAGLARLWARLSTGRPRRSATPSPATACRTHPELASWELFPILQGWSRASTPGRSGRSSRGSLPSPSSDRASPLHR